MDENDKENTERGTWQDHPLVVVAMLVFMGASLIGLKMLAEHFGIPIFRLNPVPIGPLPLG